MKARIPELGFDRFWSRPVSRPFSALKRSRAAIRAISVVVLLWPLAYLLSGAPMRVPDWLYPAALGAWALFVLFLNTEGRVKFASRERAGTPDAALSALEMILREAGFEVNRAGPALSAKRGALDIVTGGVESEWREFPIELTVSAAAVPSGAAIDARALSRAWLWGTFFGSELGVLLEETAEAAASLDAPRLAAADRAVAIRQQKLLGGGLATRINSAFLACLLVSTGLLLAYSWAWFSGTRVLLHRERLKDRLADVKTPGRKVWKKGEPLPPEVVAALSSPRPSKPLDPRYWKRLVSPEDQADALGVLFDDRGGNWETLYVLHASAGGWEGESLTVPKAEEETFLIAGALGAAGLLPMLIAMLAAYAFLGTMLAQRIAGPLLRVRDALRRVGEGDFSVRLRSSRSDEVGQLERAVDWASEELRRRELLKDLFGKYLSRQVAERLIADPDRSFVAGESREVSVLFADVRGFTKFSESRKPEEVVATLNEYFSVVVDVIAAREGALDKFIGDGLMAVFGAPVRQEDHAFRAVATGLEMQSAIAAMNSRRTQRGLGPVDVGIGVNTGTAISGNLGSLKRMEFTVIGDSVNLASRLEHEALKGQVLIGRSTYELVKAEIDCERVGAVPIKGKKDPVEIWRATRLRQKMV